MADALGFSFDPSQGDIRTQQQGGGFLTASPNSDVNVLSLRIPTRQAPNTVAPLPLLTSHGGATAGAVDPQFLHLLSMLQPMFAQQAAAQGGGQSAPAPNVPGLYPPGGGTSAPAAPSGGQAPPTQTAPPLTIGGGGGHIFNGGALPGAPAGGGFGSLPTPPSYQPPPSPYINVNNGFGAGGGMGGGNVFDPFGFGSLA